MRVIAYDHVGIRVTDAARSIQFYGALGFVVDEAHSDARVAEVVSPSGVRLALIFNGVPAPDGKNVLLDVAPKRPGFTHAAFIVSAIDEVVAWAVAHEVAITEGPVDWGRRLTCFLRDPDGNVLEFNQLAPERIEP